MQYDLTFIYAELLRLRRQLEDERTRVLQTHRLISDHRAMCQDAYDRAAHFENQASRLIERFDALVVGRHAR